MRIWMKYLLLIIVGGFLLSCMYGGCGLSSNNSEVTGIVADPYIVNAQFQERLNDAVKQTSTYSNTQGRFYFNDSLNSSSSVVMSVSGEHLGSEFNGTLHANALLASDGEIVISPLTTLVSNLMQLGLTKAQAMGNATLMINKNASINISEEELTQNPMENVDTSSTETTPARLKAAITVNEFLKAANKTENLPGYKIKTENKAKARQMLLENATVANHLRKLSNATDNYLNASKMNDISTDISSSYGADTTEYPVDRETMFRALQESWAKSAVQISNDSSVQMDVNSTLVNRNYMKRHAYDVDFRQTTLQDMMLDLNSEDIFINLKNEIEDEYNIVVNIVYPD